ncbi:MAG TPA: SseB family protein [Candidatus Kapabacteria bacterium]|nr:SseB family protein [Candidatus Kapabacteria bacterium]
MDNVNFSPLNELETVLQSVRAGGASVSVFMEALMVAQVFVLLDQDPGPEGDWHESASPLVLSNHQGMPVLAIFTAPERAIAMTSQFPAFAHGLLIDFTWLLQRISAGAGLVINPGTLLGMEMPPAGVQRLQQDLRAGGVA